MDTVLLNKSKEEKYLIAPTKENVCVMFSGGFDSTLLLIKAIELKRDGKIKDVYAVYIDCDNFPNNKKQKECKDEILKYIGYHLFESGIVKHVDIYVKPDMVFIPNRLQAAQSLMFLPTSILGIPNNTEIWFGMIENDTISDTSSLSKEKALNEMISIMSKHFIELDNIVARCPLLHLSASHYDLKSLVIDKLLDYNDVIDFCYSCESISYNDKNENCACIKHTELLNALLSAYKQNFREYKIEENQIDKQETSEEISKITKRMEIPFKKMLKIKQYINKNFPEFYSAMEMMIIGDNKKSV